MINLVPAKCPSCGAKLELDDNMKKAECKYCRNTIIVDDAIEKYELEISGNVKVSDVKDYSDKLLIVKKHIKLGKYEKAKELLENILEDDEYNLEALKDYVTLLLDYRNEFYITNEYGYLGDIDDKIRMIECTDDNGKYKKFIKDIKEKRNDYEKEINDNFHNRKINDLLIKCNDYINLDKLNSGRINELQEHFKVDIISIDSLSKSVKENVSAEINYVNDLIANYYKTKEINENKENKLKKVITFVISAIILLFEWSYIIKDIIHSLSNFSILAPIAALIYIGLGIGLSLIIIRVAHFISALISKAIIKIFN